MASELCMNCFSVKGQYEVCPYCGYVEGTPPVQPHCLTPGTILGNHFIVGTVIGFGGFGITYKCYDTTLGIIVAAKEFYPMGLVNRSPGETKVGLLSGERREQYNVQLKRFFMEAQSVAQFGKAKDIVNIYDYFEENQTAYIIMEYIDGILLKDYLEKQGAMPADIAMSVIMPIIEGVKKIHSKGIIHRDISPDNIFITDEHSIKIFDFGAAQLNDSKEGMAGEKVIKVGYSAPEQYREKSRQGFYTDIYSVGAIMYQMLTGRKPVESTEREYKDKLKSPLELGVKVNSNVDRAVMEAMAVQPELRYQSIQQFEEALRNKRTAEYPKDKIKKRKRKRNWIIASAVALVLAVGVAIAFVKTGTQNPILESNLSEAVDTLVVWVENEDQEEQLKATFDSGFHRGELSSDNEKQQKFWDENEKVTNIDVEVYPDMEEQLKATPKEDWPDMYITDHVSEEQKTDLISLKDVYQSLDDKEYVYLDEQTYTKYFPANKELPTGLDTLLLYVCELYEKEENTLNEKTSVLEGKDETIRLSELLELFSGQDETEEQEQKQDILVFEGDAAIRAAYLQDEDAWKALLSKKGNGTQPDCSKLIRMQSYNEGAYQPKYYLGSSLEDSGTAGVITSSELCGNCIVSGASLRKRLSELKDAEGTKNKNQVKNYQTYVVVNDKEEMLVIYSERFGIRKNEDSNREMACKRLLYVMMQDGAQSRKDSSKIATTFPIKKEAFNTFKDTHSYMRGFINCYEKNKNIVVADGITGNMTVFAKGLEQKYDSETIKAYCQEYGKNSTEDAAKNPSTGK
jgi:serine/threonine protein kinase